MSNLLVVRDIGGAVLVSQIPTDVVNVDSSNAFDSVNQACVLERLKSCGLGMCPLTWLEGFLMRHCQWARVWSGFSISDMVSSGVTQGSALSLVMSIGKVARTAIYTIGGIQLQVAEIVKDFGVLVQNKSSTSRQCVKVSATGMRKLCMLWHSFRTLTFRNSPVLFTSTIHTAMEYCMPAPCQRLTKESYLLERVQWRCNKLMRIIQQLFLPAASRDTKSVLPKLLTRSGDLIAFYHILKSHFGVELDNWFQIDVASMRWTPLKLYKSRIYILQVWLRLSMRVVIEWNKLTPNVVMVLSVEVFKRHPYSHYTERLHNQSDWLIDWLVDNP